LPVFGWAGIILIMKDVVDDKEWFYQADYDIGVADDLFKTGRYVYSIFMCHLSIEKGMKAIYYLRHKTEAPKTHSLIRLIDESQLTIPADLLSHVSMLSAVSVPTRYPRELRLLQKEYNKEKTAEIIAESKKVLQWLKETLKTLPDS
jgi:HEPN domain-containing protein